MTMLRPAFRSSAALRTLSRSLKSQETLRSPKRIGARCAFATQSGDDTQKPTALAKLHLEDGTTLTGLSFGSHEAVEGEVRAQKIA